MTTFNYKISPRRDVKAVVHLFDGGPKLCLAIKTHGENKTVWFYEDGSVSVQPGGMNENNKDVVQLLYEGDSITINF